jgi:hypothetical protein
MSEVPTITINEFKKLKASQIKEMKSVEVLSDGSYLFTAIIPPEGAGMSITDTIRIQADFLGSRGNSVGGKNPPETITKDGG